MSNYLELIHELETISRNPKIAVARSMKDSGKKAVGIFPIYAPEEVVYAAGLLPVGMWGGPTSLEKADTFLQNFCCSVMRANMEYALKGTYNMLSAVVVTAFCDSLKAMCKNWPYAVKDIPVLGFVYPQNRISSAREYLLKELRFLMQRLEELFGVEITDKALDEAFAVYEDYRAASRKFVEMVKDYPVTLNARTRHLILKASWFMDKKVYTEKLGGIIDGLSKQPPEKLDDFKVILSGIMVDAASYLNILVDNKITVVADDLVQESRQFRTLSRAAGTTLERIADRYLDTEGCSLVYDPSKSRADMLIRMAKELNADGIFYCQMKFCEPEAFDYPLLKLSFEKAGVKHLYIEADQQVDAPGQLANRIQTFVEVNKK
jgi:benzoyl-CoA reductase/2-hydroxyglutaryl-CoA dehydratase subunit BcrC/BadD/HgdB